MDSLNCFKIQTKRIQIGYFLYQITEITPERNFWTLYWIICLYKNYNKRWPYKLIPLLCWTIRDLIIKPWEQTISSYEEYNTYSFFAFISNLFCGIVIHKNDQNMSIIEFVMHKWSILIPSFKITKKSLVEFLLKVVTVIMES